MSMSPEVSAYRQAEAQTASPIDAVILHCDTLVRDLKQAVAAIRAGDIEERVKQSNHALLVLQALDLMLDFQNGGSTAKELARVYSYVRAKIVESQIKLDPAILERQIEFILQLRHAWQQALAPAAAAPMPAKTAAPLESTARPYGGAEEEVQTCSWSA